MCCGSSVSSGFRHAHTDTTTLTGTEYLSTLIGGHGLRHIDEDVAAVLHQVLFLFTEVALSGTIYLLDGIQLVVGVDGTEVDEGILQERLVVACLGVTIFVEVCTEVLILVVIHTVGTTEDLLHAPLYIFYIGSGVEHSSIRHLAANGIVAQTTVEVGLIQDLAAEVVTAINEVANVRETVSTNIRLSMSEDVGITCSSEGVEDTAVA